MSDIMSFEDALFFNAAHRLRLHLHDQLPDKTAGGLVNEINPILAEASTVEERQDAVDQVFAIIHSNQALQQAWAKLVIEQQERSAKGTTLTADYQVTPGGGLEKKPGPLMKCPVEGCIFQQYLMVKGEELFCEEHSMELVRADR